MVKRKYILVQKHFIFPLSSKIEHFSRISTALQKALLILKLPNDNKRKTEKIQEPFQINTSFPLQNAKSAPTDKNSGFCGKMFRFLDIYTATTQLNATVACLL